ncbi:MAG: cobalt transporter CbiM [Nitrospirae bacterium]|nr:cobalt transporter CbiM [Nitrospirota bacterium]
MHIPDGYLSPQTYIPMYAVTGAFWAAALRKLKKGLAVKEIPYLTMASVFSFLIMMFNIPVPGGTTGHAVGAAIVAVVLGPWTAVVAVSVVIIVQALVFGDGGITALGANCFNMAVVMPFISYGVFTLIRGKSQSIARLSTAAFLSGYAGLLASAMAAAVELGVQPIIAAAPDGRPLYAPYPLSITIPAMAIGHMFLLCIVEGMMTMLLLRYFQKHDPEMIYALRGAKG